MRTSEGIIMGFHEDGGKHSAGTAFSYLKDFFFLCVCSTCRAPLFLHFFFSFK